MDSAVMIVVALAAGLWAGASFARFKRARTDLRGGYAQIPGLRKKRLEAGLHSAKAILLVAFLLLVFIMGLRAAGRF